MVIFPLSKCGENGNRSTEGERTGKDVDEHYLRKAVYHGRIFFSFFIHARFFESENSYQLKSLDFFPGLKTTAACKFGHSSNVQKIDILHECSFNDGKTGI